MTAIRALGSRRWVSPETLSIRLLQLAGLGAFLAAWQVVGSSAPGLYSTPIRVALDFGRLLFEEDLVVLTLQSIWTLGIGLAAALVIGVTVGLLMGRYRLFALVVEPYFAAYYSVPRVALVPLMIIWFGIDRQFVVATVIFASTILIVFATAAGVREALMAYSEVASSFRITGRAMFTKILLPGAVPFIATGMRLAVQRALVAVIVAEFLVGLAGLGKLLRDARVTLATDRMFASAFACMIIGIVLILITSYVERRLSQWRPKAF